MFFGRYILCIVLIFICNTIEKRIKRKCKTPTGHYEDINCKPVYKNPKDTCPIYFDCDPYYTRLWRTKKCIFEDAEYDNGQIIQTNFSNSACVSNCTCSKTFLEDDFTCTDFDCGENLETCPCTINDQASCKGHTDGVRCRMKDVWYHDNQEYYVQEACVKCICMLDDNDKVKLDTENCQPIRCKTQLMNRGIKHFCAPLYTSDKRCCPTSWYCDEKQTNVVKTYDQCENFDKKKNCIFGNQIFEIGDSFEIIDDYVCECLIPPLTVCIK